MKHAHFTPADEHRRELSRKLHLLMDAVEVNTGKPLRWSEIQAELAHQGVQVSRARWSYMLHGTGGTVSDRTVLTALANVFGVPPEYLWDHSSTGLPERVEAQIELVRAMRKARILEFAARYADTATTEDIRELTTAISRLRAEDESDGR
ncbi:hypothetical protein C5E12_07300 [Rathayibacter rathayi]|uniref:hypothetical protein n=1 Tax=Rathayibacter rathayi TaxID=33887 RepID=UPI000CE8AD66|nr:hypothetical protein [Rathayibacter rathayi]PPI71643.1 hypothetical protein C5E12_07300 [Rathayibacter rathayi]